MDEGVKRLVRRAVEATSAEEAKQFASAAMDCASAIKCSNGRSAEETLVEFPDSVEVPVVVNPDVDEPVLIGVLTLPRSYVGYLACNAVEGNPLGLKCRVACGPKGYELLHMAFVGLPAQPKS